MIPIYEHSPEGGEGQHEQYLSFSTCLQGEHPTFLACVESGQRANLAADPHLPIR